MLFQNAAWDYKTFNFDHDVILTDDKMGSVLNALDPNLRPFKSRGGKLILYHGWSDAAIAPTNSIAYYTTVASRMGKKQAAQFVELYMVPGMQHCGGGPGSDGFRRLRSGSRPGDVRRLEQWVEKGTAPEKIIASKYKNEGNPASGALRTRPLCPYPQVAHYKGSGSTDDAANFTCATPK